MKNISTRKRSLATLARIARRRLVVRVRPLALAAAVALGANVVMGGSDRALLLGLQKHAVPPASIRESEKPSS